ncbi:MAG: hypothetical protein ISR52_08640 [Rhodospirillales bacterium]|nr:hypothetical protein [Rhodospirillales bacterium]
MVKPVVVEKEMGINEAEFFRNMRRTLEGRDHRVEGTAFILEDNGGDGCRLEVAFEAQPPRTIALLSVPVAKISLTFTGYDKADRQAFVDLFDRHFQRGGG